MNDQLITETFPYTTHSKHKTRTPIGSAGINNVIIDVNRAVAKMGRMVGPPWVAESTRQKNG